MLGRVPYVTLMGWGLRGGRCRRRADFEMPATWCGCGEIAVLAPVLRDVGRRGSRPRFSVVVG